MPDRPTPATNITDDEKTLVTAFRNLQVARAAATTAAATLEQAKADYDQAVTAVNDAANDLRRLYGIAP